jgi:hypothetical protein
MDNKIDKVLAAALRKQYTFLLYHFLGFYQFTEPPFPIIDQAQQDECFITYE